MKTRCPSATAMRVAWHRAAHQILDDPKVLDDPAAATVIYKTKMVEGRNRNFEIFDALDFLAAVTSHKPPARERPGSAFSRNRDHGDVC